MQEINKEIIPFDWGVRIKEIEFLQNIINRLSNFQLALKVACVTLLTALIAIASNSNNSVFTLCIGLVSVLGIIVFKKLDKNYLYTEKIYRIWCENVINERWNSRANLFEMNPREIERILQSQDIIEVAKLPISIKKTINRSWSLQLYNYFIAIVVVFYIIVVCVN